MDTISKKQSKERVFVYCEGESAKNMELEGTEETLGELLVRAGFQIREGLHVVVERPDQEDSDFDPETDDEAASPLDPNRSLKDYSVVDRASIHCCGCRLIKVTVNYQGESVQRSFQPASRVRRVERWAKRRLGLQGSDAEGLKLYVCGVADFLSENARLGELVKFPNCEVCLDLLPKDRINGRPEGAVSSPDERLLRADVEGCEFQLGMAEGRWGFVPDRCAWPKVVFWVAAAQRAGAPERYYFCLDCTNYPSQAPTGTLWDPETGEGLAFDKRPTGSGNTGKVFRTDWENAVALYHPFDRFAANSHPDWKVNCPHLVWGPKRSIVDLLTELYGLLHCEEYSGVRG